MIIVRGLPGSGKSTKAKELITAEDVKHFEADMFHTIDGEYCFDIKNISDAHKWCQAQTAFWLNRNYTVVVSNTFTTLNEIEKYLDIADQYDTEVEYIEMKETYGNIHNVPQEVLDKMESRWEELKDLTWR